MENNAYTSSDLRSLRLDELLSMAFLTAGSLAPVIMYIGAEELGFNRNELYDNLLGSLLSLSFMFAFLFAIIRFPQQSRHFREFAPFLFIIAIYMRIHDLIHLVNPEDFHHVLANAEAWLFNGQPVAFMERFAHPWLTEWFSFAYLHYYLVTFFLVLILYKREEMEAVRKIMFTMMVTNYLGFSAYMIFPTASPYMVIPEAFQVDIWQDTGPLAALTQWIVSLSPERPRDAFPSLHNAVTLLTLMAAWQYHRKFFWFHLPLAISLALATVYLRYHFVLDILAGYLVLFAALALAPVLERWWQQKQFDWFGGGGPTDLSKVQ